LRLLYGFLETIGKEVWFHIRFSFFLLYRNCKRLREFEELEISSKAVELAVNNKEKKSSDFCLDFVQARIRPQPYRGQCKLEITIY
jgi:hypothetical protein